MTYQKPAQRSDLLWYGIDLDGTLAEPLWTPENPTSEIGKPIAVNVIKARKIADAGYKIHIHTSRPWTDYESIEYWLNFYGIPFDAIQCGKPLYYRYIDDRALPASNADWLDR